MTFSTPTKDKARKVVLNYGGFSSEMQLFEDDQNECTGKQTKERTNE